MIVEIDVSIFCFSKAIGNVVGALQLPISPVVGDQISFQTPVFQNVQCPLKAEFNGMLKVVGRILTLGAEDQRVIVVFESVVFKDKVDAVALMDYLEKGFGLYATHYESSG